MAACPVHHELSGPADAPVLVLLNSLGSDLRIWEPQVAALRDRYRIVRLDSRGHGRSPVPPGPYSLAELGEDIIALLDRLQIERASLAGVSLGGMTAIWLGAHAPDRVDKLVLCCTSALLGPAAEWRRRAELVSAEGTEAVADAVLGRWITPEFARRREDVAAWMRSMIAATPAAGYAGCCAAIERMDLREDLAAVTAPTLVIAGDQDPATPPEHGRSIAAGIAGARFTTIPGAHLASFESADTFNALLSGHLSGVGPS